MDRQIGKHTPPAFVWHTVTDQVVDYRKSVLFAQAMIEQGRPCELHLFPCGDHGMLLGLGTQDVVMWPRLARNFLETQWQMRDGREVMAGRYTNRYQAEMERKAQMRQDE